MKQAVCRQEEVDIEVFFPNNGRYAYGPARKICERCPVTQECLEYCLKTEVPDARHGMFGGTTPDQRYRMFD